MPCSSSSPRCPPSSSHWSSTAPAWAGLIHWTRTPNRGNRPPSKTAKSSCFIRDCRHIFALQSPLPAHAVLHGVRRSHAVGPALHRQRALLSQRVRRLLVGGPLSAQLLADRPLLEHHTRAHCALLPPPRNACAVGGGGACRARRPHAAPPVGLGRPTDAQLLPARGVEVRREGGLALQQDGHGGLPENMAHLVLLHGGWGRKLFPLFTSKKLDTPCRLALRNGRCWLESPPGRCITATWGWTAVLHP